MSTRQLKHWITGKLMPGQKFSANPNLRTEQGVQVKYPSSNTPFHYIFPHMLWYNGLHN